MVMRGNAASISSEFDSSLYVQLGRYSAGRVRLGLRRRRPPTTSAA